MSWPGSDPLEGLEQRPLETQVAVLANEVRNQKNSLNGLRADVAALRRTLVGFAITVAGSSLVFAMTIFAAFK